MLFCATFCEGFFSCKGKNSLTEDGHQNSNISACCGDSALLCLQLSFSSKIKEFEILHFCTGCKLLQFISQNRKREVAPGTIGIKYIFCRLICALQ